MNELTTTEKERKVFLVSLEIVCIEPVYDGLVPQPSKYHRRCPDSNYRELFLENAKGVFFYGIKVGVKVFVEKQINVITQLGSFNQWAIDLDLSVDTLFGSV